MRIYRRTRERLMTEDFQYSGTELLQTGEDALRNYNAWIVRQFFKYLTQFPDKKTVLDYGAGVGTLSVIFKRLTRLTPLALEIDPAQRTILKQRGIPVYASIEESPQNLDFVYSSSVSEHIEDDLAALIILRKKMHPDGRIAIYVPAFESIWTSMDDNVGHFRRYTKEGLGEKLVRAGFEVENIRYTDSIGFVLAFFFKIIGSKSGNPSRRSYIIFDRVLFPLSLMLDKLTGRFFGKNVLAFAHIHSPQQQ